MSNYNSVYENQNQLTFNEFLTKVYSIVAIGVATSAIGSVTNTAQPPYPPPYQNVILKNIKGKRIRAKIIAKINL